MADDTGNGHALLVVRLKREDKDEDEEVSRIGETLQMFGIAGEVIGRWQTRAMTEGTTSGSTFTVVGLEREDEEVSRVVGMLRVLGIPDEEVERGRQLCRSPGVVLRVPHKRAAEAILALESQGYADVLAYQLEEDR